MHLGFCLLNEFENGVFCYCCCYYLELKEWGVLLRDLDKAYRIFQNCYYCLEFVQRIHFCLGWCVSIYISLLSMMFEILEPCRVLRLGTSSKSIYVK